MYPIKFENLYYSKIWGGRDFEIFRNNLPEGDIGESWDIACHPHGTSVVKNGEYAGTRLDDLIRMLGHKLIGTEIEKEPFPLLLKLINAKDKLSVQVHPDDQYGKEKEGELGKTEAWYVIEAFEGANLVVGTKDCTKEEFERAIKNGTLNQYMNRIKVQKGEVYFIKSGLIHAIGEGVIIAEVQQNSDTTYRVFDYNRGRELHVEKALEVVDLKLRGQKSTGLKSENKGYSKIYYCGCEKFSLELYDVYSEVVERSDPERFYIFTCVEGEGIFFFSQGNEKIQKGESVLIPASLGSYTVQGEVKLLKSYVPNMQKLKREILENVIKD